MNPWTILLSYHFAYTRDSHYDNAAQSDSRKSEISSAQTETKCCQTGTTEIKLSQIFKKTFVIPFMKAFLNKKHFSAIDTSSSCQLFSSLSDVSKGWVQNFLKFLLGLYGINVTSLSISTHVLVNNWEVKRFRKFPISHRITVPNEIFSRSLHCFFYFFCCFCMLRNFCLFFLTFEIRFQNVSSFSLGWIFADLGLTILPKTSLFQNFSRILSVSSLRMFWVFLVSLFVPLSSSQHVRRYLLP